MPSRGDGGRQRAHLRVGDLRVGGQFGHPLRRVHELDDPGPVVGQRVVDGLAAQGRDELLVGLLCARGRHAVGDVQPGQRRDAVDAAVGAVGEPVPADVLQEAELHVRPRLDVLGDVVEVVPPA